jgi:glycopeptide antibiotics resistance protein
MISWYSVNFVALIVSMVAVSIALARRWQSMSWLARISLLALAVYLPFVVGLTLGGIPIDASATASPRWQRPWVNLMPFATIRWAIGDGLASGLYQVVGNVMILAPLGFLMPVTWHRCRQPLTAFLTGLAAAITIELSQLAISLSVGVPYRIFDVDDIILNTLGVMLGWALWKAMAGLALPVGQSA